MRCPGHGVLSPATSGVLLATAIALACCAARAAPDDRQRARLLTEQGAESLRRGDYTIALEQFRAAHRVFPSPRLHYDVAIALDGLQRSDEAIEAFERFLAEAPDAPEAHRAYAARRVRDLDARCAHLRVTTEPRADHLLVDGRPVPSVDGSPRCACRPAATRWWWRWTGLPPYAVTWR